MFVLSYFWAHNDLNFSVRNGWILWKLKISFTSIVELMSNKFDAKPESTEFDENISDSTWGEVVSDYNKNNGLI